jgi:hypothetical protein
LNIIYKKLAFQSTDNNRSKWFPVAATPVAGSNSEEYFIRWGKGITLIIYQLTNCMENSNYLGVNNNLENLEFSRYLRKLIAHYQVHRRI